MRRRRGGGREEEREGRRKERGGGKRGEEEERGRRGERAPFSELASRRNRNLDAGRAVSIPRGISAESDFGAPMLCRAGPSNYLIVKNAARSAAKFFEVKIFTLVKNQ